ncbi:MAG: hypothetical protein H7Y02_02795 [Candidatus Obscuribacterales bacterium]|nr:hypothetical protein [Steroidobacteraceae bacterium]
MGCEAQDVGGIGLLINIRPQGAGDYTGRVVYGIALDLDNGKIYSRTNGVWSHGAPGTLGGRDVKLNRLYSCGVTSTIALKPLRERNFISLNFGATPFAYSLPDGYRPQAVP